MERGGNCLEGKLNDSNYSSPVPWIGLYIAVATLVCLLLLLLDVIVGFRNRKRWVPCRFFPLNSVTLTFLFVAVKLPLDLTTSMPSAQDQLSKITGTTLQNEVNIKAIKGKFTMGEHDMFRGLNKSYLLSYNFNPQFVLSRNVISTLVAALCAICSVLLLEVSFRSLVSKKFEFHEGHQLVSDYKWLMRTIVVSQIIAVLAGTSISIFRVLTWLGHFDLKGFGIIDKKAGKEESIILSSPILFMSSLEYFATAGHEIEWVDIEESLKAHYESARPRYQTSSISIVLLLKIASISIPSSLSNSLSDAFGEVFDIVHFVDKQMSSLPRGLVENVKLAKSLWESRNFNKVLLSKIVEKIGK
ncbi:hypothetical protein Sjap_009270 [Stephania japonica]|uniref:Uncharacterized protein n=1 Tax=Stephania japonica TaxID=461633 RepID=A0AAP0JRS7_9MAGN